MRRWALRSVTSISAKGQAAVCELPRHMVNTICHTACPDGALLPGREAFFISYAERTLLECPQERQRQAWKGQGLQGTARLVAAGQEGLAGTFLGWEVNSQLSGAFGSLILPPACFVTLGKVLQPSEPLCSHLLRQRSDHMARDISSSSRTPLAWP